MRFKFFLFLLFLLSAGCYSDLINDTGGKGNQSDFNQGGEPLEVFAKGATVPFPQPPKKWTVMVYMAADNNLSSFSAPDIREMMKSGSDENFNIIIMWDNDPSQESGAAKHGYYYVDKSGAVLLKDTGEVNTGKVNTAKNFIEFTVKNFPSAHYMWIYWNHGGAVDRSKIISKGVAWDDTDNGDHLTETEQKEIMAYFKSKAGQKIDIVGFDACLMATAEIVYQYRDFSDYLVASEETIPGNGWDYTFLSKIKSTPSITPLTLAKNILTYYKKCYSKTSDGPGSTLSVIDLSYAQSLTSAIDDFAVEAMKNSSIKSQFVKLCSGLPMFGWYESGSTENYYTRDLYAYMKKIYMSDQIMKTVKDKAKAVMDLISDKKLVVSEWHGSDWSGAAYGISITLKYATPVYKKLDICVTTKWDEFLNWAGFPNNNYAN